MAFAYLYEPEIQYQTKDGRNNTNGFLRVYLAATDDPATTYSDFNGTLNQQDIRLDDDGRAVVIVDDSKAYRLEVYDPEGALLFTCSPVTAMGGGGGSGMNSVQVISTDGTVTVSSSTSAGTRYFDLSVAIDDNKPAKWADRTGTATSITGDGEWHELGNWVDIGTTTYFNGWQLYTDAGYDVAGSLEMVSGDADALSSIDVRFLVTLDGVTQVEEFGRIDPTKDRDRVSFEWKQEGLDHQVVNARIFVRASEDMDVSLVSRACYNEEVNGIIGNGGGDYIAGDYIEIIDNLIQATGLQPLSGMSAYAYESSLSSKLDASASSEFYPTSNPSGFVTGGPYVYESSYSSFSSETTNNISSLSSLVSAISGQTGDFVEKSSISAESSKWNEVSGLSGKVDESAMSAWIPYSALEGEGGKVTGVSGSAFKGHEYTGINPVTVDNTADTISVEHRTLCVDSTMTAYNSGSSAVIGVNVAGLDLSSKMDASASSLFYPADNPSGYITGVDLTPYQLTAEMSAYAHESSLSAKLDASASGEFYSTSNPSGFLTAHQSLAGYATEAYVDSSVSSKLDTTAFSTVSGDFLTSHQSLAGYATESYVDSAVSGKLDVTASSQFLTSLPDDLAYTSDVASAVSGKMDKSESSSFYPMDSNPSGYLTAHQSLAGYATETYVDSAVSGKLDATAYDSAEFYSTSNPSGFVDGASASAIASAYQVVSSVGTSQNGLTSIVTSINSQNISAAYAEFSYRALYDNTGRTISSLPDSAAVSAIASSYAESAVSSKLDASASSDFYSTSNPSGFITGIDLSPYQLTADMSGYYTTANESGFIDSAYVEGQVSGKQDASAMTAYQEISGMTAYQPSGNYQSAGNYASSSDLENYQPTSSMSAYQETSGMSAYVPYSAINIVEV